MTYEEDLRQLLSEPLEVNPNYRKKVNDSQSSTSDLNDSALNKGLKKLRPNGTEFFEKGNFCFLQLLGQMRMWK